MPMRDDFAVFILSHGRPDGVHVTIDSLARARYSGRWYIVLDTDDETAPQYVERWGAERILTFDKDEIAKTFDLADNGGSRGVIVYARNVVDQLAAGLGLRYYQQLDDDYSRIGHRMDEDGSLRNVFTRHYDDVLEAFLEFLEVSGALTVAFAQGGDLLGGIWGWYRRPMLRKAMNTFIARVGRPIGFVGRLNEDVSTYVWRGGQGELFLTVTEFAIGQAMTQQQAGGMTGAYLDSGTYRKSFYTVMFAPSCVKVSAMGSQTYRIHHLINWNHAVPKIVPGSWHKQQS